MARPKVLEVNVTTGEENLREMTDEEYEQHLKDQRMAEEQRTALEAEKTAKAEAKASAIAKLAQLGLTEEEAKAIAG
jgi:DNA-binding transcriptional regulator YhcF (GntR family)